MRISDHFTLDEFTISQHAARNGISNTPNHSQVKNLTELCAYILEPLRVAAGSPVVISSGFRSPKVNALAGGSKTSDHMDGLAADLTVPGMTTLAVCRLIVMLNLPFKQLINEFNSWTHVSFDPLAVTPKRERKTAVYRDGEVVYLKGLL
jgi:hypothetical protein